MIPKLKAPKWFLFLVAIMLMCGLAAIMVPNGLAELGFVAPLIAAIIAPALANYLWSVFKFLKD
jgi:hypothetical protein